MNVGRRVDFVGAAMALLEQNLDLARWVICLSSSWGTYPPQPDLDCMNAFMTGGGGIWLISRIPDEGATAFATDILADGFTTLRRNRARELPREAEGVIIPIDHGTLRLMRDVYEARGEGWFCAIATIAALVLHEWMHLCGKERAHDSLDRFALANMIAISWLWALAKRYPCMRSPCCPKTGNLYFMTSEPDGRFEISPSWFPLPFYLPASEPFPWGGEGC